MFLIFACLLSFFVENQVSALVVAPKEYYLNSSNPKKIEEFHRLFAEYGVSLKVTSIDLPEIDAEPLIVATHKASQMLDFVLIEDTSLEIEGVSIGINLKWFFGNILQVIDQYIGRKAAWRVILAYKEDHQVYLYEGVVKGMNKQPEEGKNLDFNAYFFPEELLDEANPEQFNARAFAVKALIDKKPVAVLPVITEWNGNWQKP